LTAYESVDEAVVPAGDVEGKGEAEGEERGRGRGMKIELVLKDYIQVNPAREVRCFVRRNILIGKFL
jgi:hypothetical protein